MTKIVRGIDLTGKSVLDYGSGAGGGAIALVTSHGAATVVGLEIEAPLIEYSRNLAAERGCTGKVEFRAIQPGTLPVDDCSYDCFYCSGVLSHFEDKASFLHRVYQALKPGGWVLGYDWFISDICPTIDEWLKVSDLDFYQCSFDDFQALMKASGFENASCEDSTTWYQEEACKELELLQGPLFDELAVVSSSELRSKFIHEWKCMIAAFNSGNLQQGYFRCQKPFRTE